MCLHRRQGSCQACHPPWVCPTSAMAVILSPYCLHLPLLNTVGDLLVPCPTPSLEYLEDWEFSFFSPLSQIPIQHGLTCQEHNAPAAKQVSLALCHSKYRCFKRGGLLLWFFSYGGGGGEVKNHSNRPFTNCLELPYQSEARFTSFHMKISFICM